MHGILGLLGKKYGVVLVFFEYLAACTHSDLLAEQGGLTEQISTSTSKTKWLYLSFTQQLRIYLPVFSKFTTQ